MKTILLRQVLPFILIFLLLISSAILIDYIFHIYNLSSIGFYFSFAGTFLILLSFVYSLRKRKIIKFGTPKGMLIIHEYLSWVGGLLILIHAGIHFNALLAWLAILTMIIAVASGLTGKILLNKAAASLAEQMKLSAEANIDKDEIQKKLFFEILAVDIMKKWRRVHIPITSVFFALAIIHIIISSILRDW
jgi:hypothetical protein